MDLLGKEVASTYDDINRFAEEYSGRTAGEREEWQVRGSRTMSIEIRKIKNE